MSVKTDLVNRVSSVLGLNIQAITTDTDTAGNIIDTQGFDSIMFVAMLGAVSAGDIVISKIEQGDDSGLSDAVEITGDDIIGALANTALDTANTEGKVGALVTKRYVRATVTSDNSANLTAGVLAILGSAKHQPVA